MVTLTNNYYAVGAYNAAACSLGAGADRRQHAAQLRVILYDVPDNIRDFVLDGNLLYAVTVSSVLVFDYTSIVGPAVTASVVIPKGTGVASCPVRSVWRPPRRSPAAVATPTSGSSPPARPSPGGRRSPPCSPAAAATWSAAAAWRSRCQRWARARCRWHGGGDFDHIVSLIARRITVDPHWRHREPHHHADEPVCQCAGHLRAVGRRHTRVLGQIAGPVGDGASQRLASTVLQLQTPIATGSGRFRSAWSRGTATGSDAAYGAFNNYYAGRHRQRNVCRRQQLNSIGDVVGHRGAWRHHGNPRPREQHRDGG